MPEVGLKEIERRLREFLGSLDMSIASARRTVEINQQIVGARQEYPGDPILMQAAFALSTLENLRLRLFDAFPILNTPCNEPADARSSAKET